MEAKLMRGKHGCLPTSTYIVYQSGVTRRACRENGEKLEGEQELKPGKDVRKAERG